MRRLVTALIDAEVQGIETQISVKVRAQHRLRRQLERINLNGANPTAENAGTGTYVPALTASSAKQQSHIPPM